MGSPRALPASYPGDGAARGGRRGARWPEGWECERCGCATCSPVAGRNRTRWRARCPRHLEAHLRCRSRAGGQGRRHRGGHGPRGTLRPVPRLGYEAPRGAGGLPRQGRCREALRRRQGAARPPHAARVRRGDPGRQAPRRVRRARAGDVAAQADARGRPRRGPRARASSTGRGRPGAGVPPPPRVRGHREAARHLRQAGLRVADHVITLREFREPLAISCQASPRLPSTHCLPTTSWQRHGVSSCQRWSNREKSIDEGFRHEINLA